MAIELDELGLHIQRLQDIEEIRQLKARYFHACDQKQLGTMKDCFSEGEILIDYGVVGIFNTREALMDLFEDKACHEHIVDTHHGQNAQIDWESPERATAIWDLYFHQINTKAQTITQLSGFYNDVFVNDGSGWKIQETIFNVTSSLVQKISDENVKVLFSGRPPQA